MGGHSVLVVGAVAALGAAAGVAAQHLPLPALPYAYDALEPHISADIMRVHHAGHHAAYTDKTNAILAELRAAPATKEVAKRGLDWLLAHLDEVPAGVRTALRNNGGGYVNHDLFWHALAPPASTGGRGGVIEAGAPLAVALAANFGSVDEFKRSFAAAAAGVFGSGWVWLQVEADAPRTPSGAPRLVITTTANQDTPAATAGRHILTALDVWEHAYYLQYRNKRADYVASFWHVWNFDDANARFLAALPPTAREL